MFSTSAVAVHGKPQHGYPNFWETYDHLVGPRCCGILPNLEGSWYVFTYGMVGKFIARRHWEIFRNAGKELDNFVLSHGAVDVQNYIFWISPVTNSWRNGLSGDLASSGLLHTNSLKQDTGHWFFCRFFHTLWDGKMVFIFITMADPTLSLSRLSILAIPHHLLHLFQSDVTKFNFSCFVSCSLSWVKS